MKQTAVEFLKNKLWQNNILSSKDLELFEQAKEMEKQQIIEAYIEGYSATENLGNSEQYYNETYKK